MCRACEELAARREGRLQRKKRLVILSTKDLRTSKLIKIQIRNVDACYLVFHVDWSMYLANSLE